MEADTAILLTTATDDDAEKPARVCNFNHQNYGLVRVVTNVDQVKL